MEIIAEFLPLIHTVNMYVNASISDDVKHIEIKDEVILKPDTNSKPFKICLGKNIPLQPNSLSGLSRESGWLSFRLQLKPKANMINCLVGQIIKDMPSLNLNSESQLVNRPLELQCSCGFSLSNRITFKRVCELPSQELFSASENWFCHLQEDWKKSSLSYKTVPSEEECFYDIISFLLHPTNVTFEPDEFDRLTCKKCLQNIGIKVGDVIKVWSHQIVWVDKDEILHCKSASEVLMSLLSDLEKQNLDTMPHLILEADKELLNIIVIDNHLNLLITETSPLNSQGCHTEFTRPYKQPKMTHLDFIILKKIACLKIFYKFKTSQDEETKKWINDSKCHTITCNSSLLKALTFLLKSSTECIPENLRKVNGFNVGYIVKPPKNKSKS